MVKEKTIKKYQSVIKDVRGILAKAVADLAEVQKPLNQKNMKREAVAEVGAVVEKLGAITKSLVGTKRPLQQYSIMLARFDNPRRGAKSPTAAPAKAPRKPRERKAKTPATAAAAPTAEAAPASA